MTNQRKKWTREDIVDLVNFIRTRKYLRGIGEDDACFLNDYFERSMSRKSWVKRIKKVWETHKLVADLAGAMNENIDGCNVDVDVGGGVRITSDEVKEGDVYTLGDASFYKDVQPGKVNDMDSASCDDCKFWKFSFHKTDEDNAIFEVVGHCRIRSVNDTDFPIRYDYEWCGEYIRKESDA